ncbi:hypothetical protein MO973_33660 [Paenibacillus sp. TRM 82003]|nr:hypothetical protein [Paenibacillus sp. TRM 82003]
MSRKHPWTNIENKKIVDSLPVYRQSLKTGKKMTAASESLAKDLLTTDYDNIFIHRREPRVKNEIRTVAEHIRRMDKIAAGETPAVHGDEPHWYSKLPRGKEEDK